MSENERFTYSDVWGWNIDGFLNTINGLDRKNNELKERVKELEDENKQLKKENKHLQCTIESNSQDDYIDFLEKQNKMLKERKDKLEVSAVTLRLIEASVLEEVLEELEKNNASSILIGKVKLALR